MHDLNALCPKIRLMQVNKADLSGGMGQPFVLFITSFLGRSMLERHGAEQQKREESGVYPCRRILNPNPGSVRAVWSV